MSKRLRVITFAIAIEREITTYMWSISEILCAPITFSPTVTLFIVKQMAYNWNENYQNIKWFVFVSLVNPIIRIYH